MSRANNLAKRYASKNGETRGTFDFDVTARDFEAGYEAGNEHAAKLRGMLLELRAENARLQQTIKTAKRLLRETHKLPQNQRWNQLYPQGETIRAAIDKFLQR